MKLACWLGYCLFAGYSSYMTAQSVAMSFELNTLWVVFIFVFTVALIAGFCLSTVIGEMQNRFNPSKAKFTLGVLGFILFWGVSFATNVHFMLMSNDGMNVVSNELGIYKNYVEKTILDNRNNRASKETSAIEQCQSAVFAKQDLFIRECESSIVPGFGDSAIGYLKDIEDYFENTKENYKESYDYRGKIYDDEKDRRDKGKTGRKDVNLLKRKYSDRVNELLQRRISNIKTSFKMNASETKGLEVMRSFINDSLYVVDLPQLTEIATPQVYYQFSKQQLQGNVYNRLHQDHQMAIDRLVVVSKTDKPVDIEKGEYRYVSYPSARMFSTFNVWDDMLHGRLPADMKLMGWILFSLIVDLVAFILRILAR